MVAEGENKTGLAPARAASPNTAPETEKEMFSEAARTANLIAVPEASKTTVLAPARAPEPTTAPETENAGSEDPKSLPDPVSAPETEKAVDRLPDISPVTLTRAEIGATDMP